MERKIINKELSGIICILIIVLAFAIPAFAAGCNWFKSDVVTTSVGNMIIPRSHHSAFLMKDGRVLIIGGSETLPKQSEVKSCKDRKMTAEIYDPKTKKFKFAGIINKSRSWEGYTTTLLQNGKVLITGGRDCPLGSIKSAEIFDPETGKSSFIEDMHFSRIGHTSTLLQNGKVLIVGGNISRKAELFDPKTNKFSIIEDEILYPIADHSAILLKDGRVLIVGGGILGVHYEYTSKVEIYNPKTNRFSEAEDMKIGRANPKLIRLNNGQILIFGGTGYIDETKSGQDWVKEFEVFDPTTNHFNLTGYSLPKSGKYLKRYSVGTLLGNGDILFTGGTWGVGPDLKRLDDVTLLNPQTGKFNFIGKMKYCQDIHTATLLQDNSVLITGGVNHKVLPYAEIYKSDK